jgi:hypothetical protein
LRLAAPRASRFAMILLAMIMIVAGLVIVQYSIAEASDSLDGSTRSKIVASSPSFNYIAEPGFAYEWIDASYGTQCNLAGQDDNYQQVSMGFTFQFYGNYYTDIYICTNGFASFSPSSTCSPTDFPSSNNANYFMLAAWWADLRAANPCNIYYQSLASPNRFVVEWNNIYTLGGSLVGSFEIVLYETGQIIYNYDYLSIDATHTCGINYGADTQFYSQYSGLSSSTNDFSIRFSSGMNYYPPTLASPSIQKVSTSQSMTEFLVMYSDQDNNPPSYIQLTLDGYSTYYMTKRDSWDSDFTDGCIYQLNYYGSFSNGRHTFEIECYDGYFTITTSTQEFYSSNGIITMTSAIAGPLTMTILLVIGGVIATISTITASYKLRVKKGMTGSINTTHGSGPNPGPNGRVPSNAANRGSIQGAGIQPRPIPGSQWSLASIPRLPDSALALAPANAFPIPASGVPIPAVAMAAGAIAPATVASPHDVTPPFDFITPAKRARLIQNDISEFGLVLENDEEITPDQDAVPDEEIAGTWSQDDAEPAESRADDAEPAESRADDAEPAESRADDAEPAESRPDEKGFIPNIGLLLDEVPSLQSSTRISSLPETVPNLKNDNIESALPDPESSIVDAVPLIDPPKLLHVKLISTSTRQCSSLSNGNGHICKMICSTCGKSTLVKEPCDAIVYVCKTCQKPMSVLHECPSCANHLVITQDDASSLTITNSQCPICKEHLQV